MQNKVQALLKNSKDRGTDRREVSDATVLFADIVGFVALSRTLGDADTCDLLDQLFHKFDALCAWHNVEKVKTIGDGYMAVAGIADRKGNHAERVARLALDLQAAAACVASAWGIEITLRIGIATGPVTAGQMGLSRTGFDVWGSTVNLASRLEGSAGAGGILVSATAKREMSDQFTLSDRGQIEIRGFGTVEAWTLQDERYEEHFAEDFIAQLRPNQSKKQTSIAA